MRLLIIVIIADIALWLLALTFYKKYRALGKNRSWATKEYMIYDFTTIIAFHLLPVFLTINKYLNTGKMGWLIAFGVFTGFFLAFMTHSTFFYVRLWRNKDRENDKNRSSKGTGSKRLQRSNR